MARTIDLGPVSSIHKSDWASSTTYERLNIVRHAGAQWICIVESSTGQEPSESSSDWALSAKDGATGATGPQGEKGDDGGLPLGFEYFQTNPNVRAGSLPLTGGLYSRTIYADLWAWVQSQDGYLISEAEWQAKAETNDGAVPFYSDGDGSTTFRVPALTVWCKGKNGDEAVGDYLADTFASHSHSVTVSESGTHTHTRGTMDITGTFEGRGHTSANTSYGGALQNPSSGAFEMAIQGGTGSGTGSAESSTKNVTNDIVRFTASKSWTGETSKNGAHSHIVSLSETGATETRPKTIIGIYCVIAFGTIAASGSVSLEDIQQAINEVRSLQSYIDFGEARTRDSTKPTYGLL